MDKIKSALESMVWQFGHHSVKDGKPIIWTGGLSALEEAFEALGWQDPKIIEDCDAICDVEGCAEWVVCQGTAWEDKGYWMVCSEHSSQAREGKPFPLMKKRAIDREISRDPVTRCLPFPEARGVK